MPNYKETKTTGEITKYIRCSKGSFRNSNLLIPNTYPHIVFNEDEVTNLPNGDILINSDVNACVAELIDPSETFNLLNPTTDEVIGTMTYGEIFTNMYSLYRYASVKRDEKVIADELLKTLPQTNSPVIDMQPNQPVSI